MCTLGDSGMRIRWRTESQKSRWLPSAMAWPSSTLMATGGPGGGGGVGGDGGGGRGGGGGGRGGGADGWSRS